MKKLLASLLCVAMLCSLLPAMNVSAASGVSDGQIEYVGGKTDPKVTDLEGTISVSKTIDEVQDGTENYFDITLTVDMTPTKKQDKSTDVVMVVDISNTMNAISDGTSRIQDARKAIKTFVNDYTTNTSLDSNRRFGLVTFNTNATAEIALTTANNISAQSIINAKVDAIKTATDTDYSKKFTNIEGGLQLAYNMLKDSTAAYKYVILLTDGFPTTYIESGWNSTSSISGYNVIMAWTKYKNEGFKASRVGTDGYFADAVSGKLCLEGVDYSDKAASKAQIVAENLKNSNINVFSIGFDLGAQTIQGYLNKGVGQTWSTVDRTGTSYVIGDSAATYREWLENKIAGGPNLSVNATRYSDSTNEKELEAAFKKILKDIELAPQITMATAYTMDPMSKDIEFLNFYDKDGKLVESNELKGESKLNAENTAVFTADSGSSGQGTINWDLIKSGYTKETRDGTDHYMYSIKYRVRVMNEADGFTENKAVETNDTTTLYYETTTPDGDHVGGGTIDYPIPQVEAYLGELEFKKVKEADEGGYGPLAGSTFELRHDGESCTVCHGDAEIEDGKLTGTSDDAGTVVIKNIPSGHDYVLVETVPADGYFATHNHTVTVYMDKVTMYSEHEYKGKKAVVNQEVEAVKVDFTVKKAYDGTKYTGIEEGKYKFALSDAKDSAGNSLNSAPYNSYYVVKACNADGIVSFKDIKFDKTGTYKFVISEVEGSDSSIIYDDTRYHVTVVVERVENTYVVKTTITDSNGAVIVSDNQDSAKNVVSFINKDRTPAEAVIEAEKMIEKVDADDTSEDSLAGFEFQLKDAEGNVAATAVSDADGKVKFPAISYNTEGTYTYTISEVSGTNPDMVYDYNTYTVTVDVKPHETEDKFVATVTYGTSEGEIPVFTNYDRGRGTLQISALKTLDGKVPKAGAFQFTIEEVGGTYKETVTNDADGVITFSKLEYDEDHYHESYEPGHYHLYKITEVPLSEDSIIYSEQVYYVQVYVDVEAQGYSKYYDVEARLYSEEDGEKVLLDVVKGSHPEINLNDNGSYFIAYDNMTRGSVKVTLEAEKTLNEKATDAEFVFQLKDADGTVVQEAKNDGKKITFAPLTFDKSGEYIYTISERIDSDNKYIRFDETVYKVLITVRPSSDSADYAATVEILKDGETYDGTPVFKNYWKSTHHEDPEEPEGSDEEKGIGAVDTGDHSPIGVWIALAVLSLGVIIIVCTRRRRTGRR